MSQTAAAAKRALLQGYKTSIMKSSMTISTPQAMLFRSSRTSPFMASTPSYHSSLSPPFWTSLMDKVFQRPNAYLKNLETAGILLPTLSSSDFAYAHLNESTSRLLAQPHYAQAAARQLLGMYQHDYSQLQQEMQHDELSLQHVARLEVPITALVQLMKLSQHVLIPPDNTQHPALWHAIWQTLQRDIYMQQDRIRCNNAAYRKIIALVQQDKTSKTTTTTTTTCTDRTNQDVQWETKYVMHQLLQRQSFQEEQDNNNHCKNSDDNSSNRLDWQEALRGVQQDLLTTSSIHWQPHHYEQYPMEFRYKLKNRTQRLELIRNFYNLIGLRQTLATTTASNDNRQEQHQQQQQEPYKHYADQVFRNDCHRRMTQSVETIESFLKTTSRELKAYINITTSSSALPMGALSEFIQPQRHEQLILRRRRRQQQQQQQQQQKPLQTNEMTEAVSNEDVEELQQDIENQQDEQKDLSDEEKMLQLHHHVTLDGALDLVFRLSQDLFGIAIVQDDTANDNKARFWNADVRLFHIYNHDDDDINNTKENKQQYLGSFFLDPYQRPGKMQGWSGHIPLYAASTTGSGAAMGSDANEKSGDVVSKANTDDEGYVADHAGVVMVLSLQLEPPVWSENPARLKWKNVRELFSQLGYAYQWILSTKSSSLIMSLAKSPANMPVDLLPVIPKFMEHWLYEKSTIYGLLAASASLSGSSSSLADFTDESIDAAHRVLSRQKALELSRHVYYATLELQLFSNLNLLQKGGGDDTKEYETIMALQNRLAREMLPDELFPVLCDNEKEDDLTPLCHVLCSDAASENQDFCNAVAWYRHVWAEAVSAHILQQLQEDYDTGDDNTAKTLVMKRWREKFRNVLLDRGAAVDVDEFKREFGLQDVLPNNNNDDDDTKEDSTTTRPSLHDALFRRYKYHVSEGE